MPAPATILSAMILSVSTLCVSASAAEPAATVAEVRVSRHGDWIVVDLPNFRVSAIAAEAETRRLAETCQQLRSELCQKWLGAQGDEWQPRCHIVLHPTASSYLREVGQGQQTAGSSLIDFQGDRVTGRRIDLRADHPDGYLGALAHEMTHVVLADRFIEKPIPRWADEGMAVLADSREKQSLHLRDLRQAHRSGRTFRVVELLTLNNYPQPSRVAAFYGQSLSLVDFLVSRGQPHDFPRFLRLADQRGYDAALAEVYHLDGVADLERQWSRHLESGELLSLNARKP